MRREDDMAKQRHDNQDNLRRNKPLEVKGGKSESTKAFIGMNVFTAEDDEIIASILANEDWTVAEVKKALPYNHSLKCVINHLVNSFCSQEEVEAHMTAPVTDTDDTDEWRDYEDKSLKAYYGQQGPKWEGWSPILPGRSESEIWHRADALGLAHWNKDKVQPEPETQAEPEPPKPSSRWSEEDDDMLRLGYAELGSNPENWKDMLSVPRTERAIEQRARKLGLYKRPPAKKPQEKPVQKEKPAQTPVTEQTHEPRKEADKTMQTNTQTNIPSTMRDLMRILEIIGNSKNAIECHLVYDGMHVEVSSPSAGKEE